MKFLNQQALFDSHGRSQNLAHKSVRAGMITLASQGIQFTLNIGSTVVLARLLTPADYGLIGMVAVIVNFAQMFKDAGLSMATVQRETISHEQISTLFWINCFISIVLGVGILAGAPLVALFYGKPELTAITVALSASFILSGLTIQHKALLRRHMQFGTLAKVQIASQLVSIAVTTSLACFGWRYWALIGGTLAHALSDALITFFFCRWVPGRMRKGTGVRGMLMFGGHLIGFDFVNYFSRNADSILIGKFIGTDALGLYAKAYGLLTMPLGQIRAPITNVAMPILSSLKNQPERYKRYYQYIINIVALLTVPLTLYCAVEADFLINLILGKQWQDVVPVFRILAMTGLIQGVAGTVGLVMISYGFSRRFFRFGIVNAIFAVASFVAGLPFGIKGVAIAYTIVNYILFIPSLLYCFYKTPVSLGLFLRTVFPTFLTGLCAGLAVFFIKYFWPDNSIMVSGLRLALFTAIYGMLSLCRPSVRELGKMLILKLGIGIK